MGLRTHAVLHGTRGNGPGLRTCVWTQGCSLRCPGCWNPETWAASGGCSVSPLELAVTVVRDSEPGTVGLSLSGGEPFEQAEAVATFVAEVRRLRPDWTVFAWSGRTVESHRRAGGARAALLGLVDLLVEGPFVSSQAQAELAWRGSRNQRLVPLSSAGSLMAAVGDASVVAEFSIGCDGTVVATGFPMGVTL